MSAHAIHLIAQRLLGDFEVLRLPFGPVLPMVATAPAGHDKDAFAIGEIEEFLGLHLAFQANCVQAHVLHIAKFTSLDSPAATSTSCENSMCSIRPFSVPFTGPLVPFFNSAVTVR